MEQRSNYSKQRELIYEAVLANRVHPTAEYIYSSLKPDWPKLSLGTVYRNLNMLSSAGRIKRLTVPNGPDRYDGDISGHYHAVCEHCGEISDLNMPYLDDLDAELGSLGFEVKSHNIVFNIVCAKCGSIK